MRITEADFDELLRSFRSSAFRLETRDHYALDYEQADFDAVLAGSPADPADVTWWRPWLEQISDLTAQGRTIGRVRVIADPPSDYQRWEIWAGPWHAAAGERVGYLPRRLAEHIGLPVTGDWWLLDDERLIVMYFTEAGEIAGKDLITDPGIVARHREWRDLAVRNATPAEEIAAA
jgi:hypothetical protein